MSLKGSSIRRRSRAAPAVGLLLVLATLPPCTARAAGRQKTVFLSQPSDWTPEMDEEAKPPSLVFRPAWTFDGFASPLAGDPVVCAGSIVAAGRDGTLIALDPLKGSTVWKADLGAPLATGPATDGTRLFVATTGARLLALVGESGAIRWSAALPAEPIVPPRVIGSRVLVATADGSLLSIESATGRVAATRLLPGRASTPATPAPSSVLIGTDHGALLALDEATLEVRFRRDVGGIVTSPPVYDSGRVWFAVSDRTVRCLRFRSGRQIWAARTGAWCSATLLARGPYLYVLCFDNDIYVFAKRNGHQLTRVRLDHRLETDPLVAQDHLFVVPYTESSIVGMSLPALLKVGRFDLEAPGEWFTTAPVWLAGRLALGYGRNVGRIMSLQVSEQAAPPREPEAPQPGTAVPAAAPTPGPTTPP